MKSNAHESEATLMIWSRVAESRRGGAHERTSPASTATIPASTSANIVVEPRTAPALPCASNRARDHNIALDLRALCLAAGDVATHRRDSTTNIPTSGELSGRSPLATCIRIKCRNSHTPPLNVPKLN
ncbi:unnamed protein product [Leptosia nina]|uniref:Uncharacterized protein n=1 Tax=Leptosia nina TaxID=320188 RepID=A0AAV1JUY8_9NEOP